MQCNCLLTLGHRPLETATELFIQRALRKGNLFPPFYFPPVVENTLRSRKGPSSIPPCSPAQTGLHFFIPSHGFECMSPTYIHHTVSHPRSPRTCRTTPTRTSMRKIQCGRESVITLPTDMITSVTEVCTQLS
jgi:hypothetical protein